MSSILGWTFSGPWEYINKCIKVAASYNEVDMTFLKILARADCVMSESSLGS